MEQDFPPVELHYKKSTPLWSQITKHLSYKAVSPAARHLLLYTQRSTGKQFMSSDEQAIAIPAGAETTGEKRCGPDRRRHSWHTVTYCGLDGRGRRRNARRSGHNYYLDWYEPRLVITGLAVLLLSCMDAMFTLTLLQKGAYEANHFMAWLLGIGDGIFVATKVAITAAGILFLLMHSHFHIFNITNGRRMLQLLAGIYGLLIVYELVLLQVLS